MITAARKWKINDHMEDDDDDNEDDDEDEIDDDYDVDDAGLTSKVNMLTLTRLASQSPQIETRSNPVDNWLKNLG